MTSDFARTAIVYDFDGTLAPGNMQEHSFLPGMGVSPDVFWREVKKLSEAQNADEVLVYMWRMLELARANNVALTRQALSDQGRTLPLFQGVGTWFDRITTHAFQRSLKLEHYVISSGNYEIIRGSAVRQHLEYVFASKFLYDDSGTAVWPATAINYTTKTQHLFRINKGIRNLWDNSQINRWIPLDERPIPFERMLFIGDGETDIPSMKMIRHQGGHAIAVYDPARIGMARAQATLYQLIAEDRVHFVAPADYREGSQLDIVVKGVLGRIARDVGYRGED